MYFIQLNRNIEILPNDFNKISEKISYGNIVYFTTEDLTINVKRILPERYRNQFSLLIFEAYERIHPHIDDIITVSINFYVSPGNYETKFYDIVTDQHIYRTGKAGGRVFPKRNLKEVGGFIAKPNEIWLLDVTKPHSVEPLSSISEIRQVVTLQSSKYSYNEVIEMIKETGYL